MSATVTFECFRQDVLNAFEKLGIKGVDFRDGDFVSYVNALITFLDRNDRRGLDRSGTCVFPSRADDSRWRITLRSDYSFPDDFSDGIKAFQRLIAPRSKRKNS